MSTYNLGVVAPTHKGVYNSNTAYKARNIVTYNGGSYMAKQDCTGISPENTTYWGVVAEAGKGSPIVYTGTFANLQADSSADKTQVYLISNESDTTYFGHMAFWNGTDWTDGGTYGGNIEDGSIIPEKTNFITHKNNINIINLKSDILFNKGINANGVISDWNGKILSGYSNVECNTTYIKSCSINTIAYFDEYLNFIMLQPNYDINSNEFTVPNNNKIKYLRVVFDITLIPYTFIMKKKSELVNILNLVDGFESGKALLNNNTGESVDQTNTSITGYTEVEYNIIYSLQRASTGRSVFALYDENKRFLESYQIDFNSNSQYLKFENKNVKYIRFNVSSNNELISYIRMYDISEYFVEFEDSLGNNYFNFKNNFIINVENLDENIKEKIDCIYVEGKNNMINYDKFIIGKEILSDGTYREDTRCISTDFIKIEKGKTYTLYQPNGLYRWGNIFTWNDNKECVNYSFSLTMISLNQAIIQLNSSDVSYLTIGFNKEFMINNKPILVEGIATPKESEQTVSIKKLKISYENLDKQILNDLEELKRYKDKNPKPEFLPLIYQNLINNEEIPRVYIEGDMTDVTKDVDGFVKLKFVMSNIRFQCYSKIKWQGNSSLSYPKKNFTIKLYNDAKAKRKNKVNVKWGNENKYVLKANYIDHSHARNIVSARLWAQIVNSRTKKLQNELETSPNFCAIDGFPVKMYINNEYQGLYTLNIPKDNWLFNMDENNSNHAVLCAEVNNNGNNSAMLSTEFRALANINGGDWSLEFPDELNLDIKSSFNNLISCVKDSTDEEFVANIETYLDLESAIDYYIYAYFGCFLDNLGKNLIMATYDGIKWICSMYDMDSTWGLFWNGSKFVDSNYRCPEDYQETHSLLWERLVQLYPQKIYDRYQELRDTVLSLENINYEFEKFMNNIPSELYEQDGQIYTGIPQKNVDHLNQIETFAAARAEYMDEKMEELVSNSEENS